MTMVAATADSRLHEIVYASANSNDFYVVTLKKKPCIATIEACSDVSIVTHRKIRTKQT